MILFWIILGIVIYSWIGIQVARFIKRLDNEDIILCIIFWPFIVIIGGFIQLGRFLIGQVKR